MTREINLNKKNSAAFGRTLAMVAVPIAIQSLIGSSLNLVDNLMVGKLGEAELNAVGVAVQIYFIHWMLLFGFTSGCATFMAQFFGAKDIENMKKTAGFALTITVTVSIVFFIAGFFFPQYIIRIFTGFPEIIALGTGYIRMAAPGFLCVAITVPLTSLLRATQQTRIPLFISVTAFVMNTCLNYALIYGNFGAPKMGIEGAALATLIARSVEMIITIWVVFKKNEMLAGAVKEYFSYQKDLAVRIVKNAIPTTLNETLWGLGTALYVAAFARVGITEGAAVQACNTINNLFIMAGFSLGDATLILVGQKLGQGKIEESYDMAKKLVKISAIVGLIAGVMLILTGKALLGFFEFTPKGESYAFLILIVYGATMWLPLYNATNITGVLRGGGDTKFAMYTEVLAVWCIGVPMAFITSLVLHLPIYFAVLAVKLEDVVKGIILTKRFISRKWAKNVIRQIESK